jgi:vacuolar-type H+-ATPase subunit I/STV1
MIDTEEGKRDGQAKGLILDSNISQPHVAQAVTIQRYAPDLAAMVLAGVEKFDTAYSTAKSRKEAMQSDERKRQDADAKLSKLRSDAPDLASLVDEARMSLDEAVASLKHRQAEEARERQSATSLVVTTLDFLAPPSGDLDDHARVTGERLDYRTVPGSQARITVERIARAIDFLAALRPYVAALEEQEGASNGRGRQSARR